MLLKWFDTRAVDAAADGIAAELLRRLPPERAGTRRQEKERKVSDSVVAQARDFAQGRKLNLYQKARFANRVKWMLLDAGYAPEFVHALSDDLAAVVASTRADTTVR
jgi:hypothetical protein